MGTYLYKKQTVQVPQLCLAYGAEYLTLTSLANLTRFTTSKPLYLFFTPTQSPLYSH